MKDKKRRNPSAKNIPESTGSEKKISEKAKTKKDSAERDKSVRDSSESDKSVRNSAERSRADRDNFYRDSSDSSMPSWRQIRNLLLVLLPVLVVFSLLYSAVFTPNKKNRNQAEVEEADTTPPQILLTRDKNYFVKAGEQYEEEGYAAYDNRDGDITKKVEVSVSRDTVRYRVKDEAGNITVRFRQIPRLDTEYTP